MYASHQYTNIPGFETVYGNGTVTATIKPGGCIHLFVKRGYGYAIISKFNTTDTEITYNFTVHEWYAYALNAQVTDVLTFFVDTGPFGVLADDWFDDYNSTGNFNGPMSKYSDMVNALSVVWSPGTAMGSHFSTECNVELYDAMFNFKFSS